MPGSKAKTVATVAFIAVVTVIGVVVGMLPTVIDGRVMAADLLPQIKKSNQRLENIECDREIPIGTTGAKFRCTFTGDDGSTLLVEYTMDRDGSLKPEVLDRTRSKSSVGGDPFDQ